MASPSVTYTFVNGNVADASQVNQNFTDIISSLTDGTKSLNIDAITAAGAAVLNGAVTLGNATGDAITVNGTFSGTGGAVVPGTSPGLVSSAGLTGNTTGNAIAAGYVGEYKRTARTNNAGVTAGTNLGVDTVITAGVWLSIFNCTLSSNNTDILAECRGGSTVLGYIRKYTVGTDGIGSGTVIAVRSVPSGSTETLSLVLNSGSGTGAVTGGGSGETAITAIRIA